MRLPLIRGTVIDSNAEWRDSLPKNMVAFITNVGDSPGYTRTLDGLVSFGEGFGLDRGGIWSDRFSVHVRVSGQTLIEVDQFGGVSDVGGAVVVSGSDQINFDNSFNSIAFVANGDYYRYVPGSGLTNLGQSPNALPFTDICFIDGYYVLTDSESLWATNISDETILNPIDFAGSDFAPDNVVGLDKTTDNKIMAFNRYTTERFLNNGGPQFPFARLPSAAIPIGIVGKRAKVSIGDGQYVVFGGGKEYSPTFYLLTNSYKKISTKEIDSVIDSYSDYELRNISLEFRDNKDQRLVICHLPRNVFAYDITYSQLSGQDIWYEWTSGDDVWRAINGVYDPRNIVVQGSQDASGWVYGDKLNNRIGKLDATVCTQYDEPLNWELTTPMVRWGNTCGFFEVKAAPGHAVIDSTIFLSTTADGVLFGPDVTISAGGPGEYQKRIIHRRLGDYDYWFGARLRGYSNQVVSLSNCEVKVKESDQ